MLFMNLFVSSFNRDLFHNICSLQKLVKNTRKIGIIPGSDNLTLIESCNTHSILMEMLHTTSFNKNQDFWQAFHHVVWRRKTGQDKNEGHIWGRKYFSFLILCQNIFVLASVARGGNSTFKIYFWKSFPL